MKTLLSSQPRGSAGAELHLQAGLHGRQHIALGHDAVRAGGLDRVRGHAGHAQVERGRRADAVVDLVVLVAAARLRRAPGLCSCSACGSPAACAAQSSSAALAFCLAAAHPHADGLVLPESAQALAHEGNVLKMMQAQI